MSASSRSPDRFATTFDHEGLVANAGLILAGTLMARLGLLALIERWVRTGSANPGPKICTVVAAMLAGATHIDHVGMLRAGRTGRVLGFTPMAPSTVGTFLRTFTFGHVRQLEAVLSRTLARAWGLGAGPGDEPLVVDLDSTICEVHGKQKQGAAYGCTKELGYHPLLAARADTGEVLGARMRKGSAGSSRGVVRFVDELVANLRRAGAAGPTTVRARLGILVPQADRPSRRPRHQMVDHRRPRIRCARSDPSNPQHRMDRHRLHQQRPRPSRRDDLRHRPRQSEAHRSPRRAPHPPHRGRTSNDCGPTGDTTHSTPTPNTTPPPRTSSTAPTPSSSSPSATSKKAPASSTSPQATTARTAHRSHAPCSPTTSATGPQHSRARRRPRTAPAAPRLVALAAVLVNRSGTPTLRYPARWPWETQFRATLSALRALPGPSG